MKIENIPADIKSKSLKEAKDEINEILTKLESKNVDLSSAENSFKRLLNPRDNQTDCKGCYLLGSYLLGSWSKWCLLAFICFLARLLPRNKVWER